MFRIQKATRSVFVEVSCFVSLVLFPSNAPPPQTQSSKPAQPDVRCSKSVSRERDAFQWSCLGDKGPQPNWLWFLFWSWYPFVGVFFLGKKRSRNPSGASPPTKMTRQILCLFGPIGRRVSRFDSLPVLRFRSLLQRSHLEALPREVRDPQASEPLGS